MKKLIALFIILLLTLMYFLSKESNAFYISTDVLETPENINDDKNAKSINENSINFLSLKKSYEEKLSNNIEKSELAKDKPNVAIIALQKDSSLSFISDIINDLPNFVAICFEPNINNLNNFISSTRQEKHEVLIKIPMEPLNFPDNNPGPLTLLTGLTFNENLKNLKKLININKNIIGFVNTQGARFAVSNNDFSPIIEYIADQKLFFVNASSYDFDITKSLLESSSAIYETFENLLPYDYLSEERIEDFLQNIENDISKNKSNLKLIVINISKLSLNKLKTWINSKKQTFNFINLSTYLFEKTKINYEKKQENKPKITDN